MNLEISLLGPFEARLEGEPITVFKSVKVRALLAYLAAVTGHPQRRSSLSGLLWPDYPQRSANQSLRQALYNLRKALGEPDYLESDRQAITLVAGEGCRIDALELERALSGFRAAQTVDDRLPTIKDALSRLWSAVEACRGSFLDGFSLPDSPAFEAWVLNRRQHYDRQVLDALDLLAEYFEREGEYSQAEAFARHQLEIEPWRESAHRGLIRALAQQGKITQALAQHETLKTVLAGELETQPSAETENLAARIRTGEFGRQSTISEWSASNPTKPNHNLPLELTSFIGREKETAAVRGLLSSNRLVTLTGIGGTGKTRLGLQVVAEVLENYPDGGWFVELAQLADPVMVPKTAAAALGLVEVPGKTFLDRLVEYLENKRLLMVLDNCEHLMVACASLVDRVLHACPRVTVLATSREILGVVGEVPYLVPPLSLPGSRMNSPLTRFVNAMPYTCLSSGRGWCSQILSCPTRTRQASWRSYTVWTASPWRSSWQLPGCACWGWSRSPGA